MALKPQLEEKIRQGCADHPRMPDRALAKLLGVGRTSVWRYRDSHGLHAKPEPLPVEPPAPAWIPPDYRLPPITPPVEEEEEEQATMEEVDTPCAECGVMGRWGRLILCGSCMRDFGFNESTWSEYLAWRNQIAWLRKERGAAHIVPAIITEDLSVTSEEV
jgi:hypothetical protein